MNGDTTAEAGDDEPFDSLGDCAKAAAWPLVLCGTWEGTEPFSFSPSTVGLQPSLPVGKEGEAMGLREGEGVLGTFWPVPNTRLDATVVGGNGLLNEVGSESFLQKAVGRTAGLMLAGGTEVLWELWGLDSTL